MKHFFDIGGNAGQTFDYLATLPRDYRDHKFWVFEPSPRHFAKLLEKCRQMAHAYDICVCPFGIGGTTGIKQFREKDDPLGDSFMPWLASDHIVHDVDNGYQVLSAVISLPEFILAQTSKNDRIVLDIDAEGSEYEILAALTTVPSAWSRVSEIMVEWHHIGEKTLPITHEHLSALCAQHKIPLTHRGIVMSVYA